MTGLPQNHSWYRTPHAWRFYSRKFLISGDDSGLDVKQTNRKIQLFLSLALSIVVVCLPGCGWQEAVGVLTSSEWHSKNFDVSATLGEGWLESHIGSPGDSIDRPGNLLQGFLNRSGPYRYIVRVESDVGLEQLSHEDYQDGNRAQYNSHPAIELIDEDDFDLRGDKSHRFRLKVDGAKGPAALYVHTFRDGSNRASVQWTFPLGSDGR